jgi:hypothetical protein
MNVAFSLRVLENDSMIPVRCESSFPFEMGSLVRYDRSQRQKALRLALLAITEACNQNDILFLDLFVPDERTSLKAMLDIRIRREARLPTPAMEGNRHG